MEFSRCDLIGQGGFGKVFTARRKNDSTLLAVKVSKWGRFKMIYFPFLCLVCPRPKKRFRYDFTTQKKNYKFCETKNYQKQYFFGLFWSRFLMIMIFRDTFSDFLYVSQSKSSKNGSKMADLKKQYSASDSGNETIVPKTFF